MIDGPLPMSKSIPAEVPASRLVWARTTSGLSRDELARACGVDAAKVRAWENGAPISVAKLDHFAYACRRPLAAFFATEKPSDPAVPTDFRTHPSARSSALGRELQLGLRRARLLQRSAVAMREAHGDLRPHGIPTATRRSKPDSLAAKIREALGVSFERQRSWPSQSQALWGWRSAFERLGGLAFMFPFPTSDARGFALPHPSTPVVVVSRRDAQTSFPFSLMHEVAHVALSTEGLCDALGGTERGNREPDSEVERYCNRVAASVLMPEPVFRSEYRGPAPGTKAFDSEVRRLSRVFWVSQEAVLRRLVDFEIVGMSVYWAKRNFWRKQWETARARQKQRTKSGSPPPYDMAIYERGRGFSRLVMGNLRAGELSRSSASELMGLRVKHFTQVAESLAHGG